MHASYLFFSCIIPLARIFSNLLYRRDESSHSCLVLNLKGKEAFSLSQFTMVFAVDFSYMDFKIVEIVSFCFQLSLISFHESVEFFQMLILYWDDFVVLIPLYFVRAVYYIDWSPSFYSKNKSHLVMILVADILLIFASVTLRYIGLQLFLHVGPLSVCGVVVMLAS